MLLYKLIATFDSPNTITKHGTCVIGGWGRATSGSWENIAGACIQPVCARPPKTQCPPILNINSEELYNMCKQFLTFTITVAYVSSCSLCEYVVVCIP